MSDIGRDFDHDKAKGYVWCPACSIAHEAGDCRTRRHSDMTTGKKNLKGGVKRAWDKLSPEDKALFNQPYFKKGE